MGLHDGVVSGLAYVQVSLSRATWRHVRHHISYDIISLGNVLCSVPSCSYGGHNLWDAGSRANLRNMFCLRPVTQNEATLEKAGLKCLKLQGLTCLEEGHLHLAGVLQDSRR